VSEREDRKERREGITVSEREDWKERREGMEERKNL